MNDRRVALVAAATLTTFASGWPVIAGRVDPGGLGFMALGWVGLIAIWFGRHKAVALPALASGACYALSLSGHRGLDRGAVIEALVLVCVVEATSWLDDAAMGMPIAWPARVRILRLELAIALPVAAGVGLMPEVGPVGLAALVIGATAVLGVVFVVHLSATG